MNCGGGKALTGNEEDDSAEGETERKRRGKRAELVRNLAMEAKANL